MNNLIKKRLKRSVEKHAVFFVSFLLKMDVAIFEINNKCEPELASPDMAKTIHISTARKMFNAREAMDIKFWKEDGSIVHANNVICTSSYFHNNTINIKFLTSTQFRKVRVISIFEINGMEIFW